MQLAVWSGRHVVELLARAIRMPTRFVKTGMGIRLKLALVVAVVFALGCAASTYRYLDGAIQTPSSLVGAR